MYCINKNTSQREFCISFTVSVSNASICWPQELRMLPCGRFKRFISFQKLKIQFHHFKVIFIRMISKDNQNSSFQLNQMAEDQLKRLIPDYLFIALFLSFICICERSRNTMNQPNIYVESHNIGYDNAAMFACAVQGIRGKFARKKNSLEAVHST